MRADVAAVRVVEVAVVVGVSGAAAAVGRRAVVRQDKETVLGHCISRPEHLLSWAAHNWPTWGAYHTEVS